jgi:hypothetical protein
MPRQARLFDASSGSVVRGFLKFSANIPPRWIKNARASRKRLEPEIVRIFGHRNIREAFLNGGRTYARVNFNHDIDLNLETPGAHVIEKSIWNLQVLCGVSDHELYRCRESQSLTALFIQILAGNIILRHLVRANFLLISVPRVFHARHYVGLERVSFLEQLVDTLRIRTLDAGQSLQISRLPTRTRSRSLR